MATTSTYERIQFHDHAHYVSVLDKDRIYEIKSQIYQWFEDAQLLGCNLYIDLELVNFPNNRCEHLWCSGRKISAAYDLIQLVKAVNSQTSNMRSSCDTMIDSIVIDGEDFFGESCKYTYEQQHIADLLYGGMGL